MAPGFAPEEGKRAKRLCTYAIICYNIKISPFQMLEVFGMNSSIALKAGNAAEHFCLPGRVLSVQPFGNGHINDTFLVSVAPEERRENIGFVLQRISPAAFHHPVQVMENVSAVIAYLQKAIAARGGDPSRETMTLIPARDGKNYYLGEDGEVWRIYLMIADTVSYDLPETEELFRQAGAAFGAFQLALDGFPAHTLYEAIPRFHDTLDRLRQLEEAMIADRAGRARSALSEAAFVRERGEKAGSLARLLKEGKLPLRVTHNDTKLNNVLFDAATGEGLCVVDLDTVMPGLCAYDFGDAIRFGANTALEDEADLDKVRFSLPMFAAYTQGYLRKAGRILTPLEKETLPLGAWTMTLECGSRFLADYLNGDTYFHTEYPEHNLVRARNQFKLLREMEAQESLMNAVVARVAGEK